MALRKMAEYAAADYAIGALTGFRKQRLRRQYRRRSCIFGRGDHAYLGINNNTLGFLYISGIYFKVVFNIQK